MVQITAEPIPEVDRCVGALGLAIMSRHERLRGTPAKHSSMRRRAQVTWNGKDVPRRTPRSAGSRYVIAPVDAETPRWRPRKRRRIEAALESNLP